MVIELLFRLIGAGVLAFVTYKIGEALGGPYNRYVYVLVLSSIALGLLLTPWVTIKPFQWIRRRIRQLPAQHLVAGTIGLVVGLIIAALLALPLSRLPDPWAWILPLTGTVFFAYFGIAVMVMRRKDLLNVIGPRMYREGALREDKYVLLDTSVIIDGRIADVSQTGFISGEMLVPRFVLNELQHIADSSDALRRNRGRRGLDMLRRLRDESVVPIRITDMDVEDYREVDDKLIMLAKQLRCSIVTNDYNLNRVAELQGVMVLNINELANAVKAVVLPGESLQVRIIQEGRELGQGVGYLDDGTMVVVENGRRYINNTVGVTVTKVLQTAAGRMIFAQPDGSG
jgi:uncharacterized protein YacL